MAAGGGYNIRLDDALHSCGKCKEVKAVNVPAVKYCLQCCIWMCRNCLDAHKLFFKEHSLSDTASSSTPSPKPCPAHKGTNTMYYCLKCKECVCSQCRLDDGAHKTHDCIGINERIDTVRAEVQAEFATLKAKEEEIDEQIKELNNKWSTVAARSKKLEQTVKQEVQTLSEEHKKLKNDSEKVLLEKKSLISSEMKKLQTYLTDADAALSLSDTSTLRSEVDSPLPEIPEFQEGLHEAGIQIILGEDLNQQQVTDVLKAVKHKITSKDVQDAPAVLDHNISLLSSLNLDHCQISSALKHWNIKPNSLTGEQTAGLIQKGSRVEHAWRHKSWLGLGTAQGPVGSDKRVVVDWDSGSGYSYKMGADDVYQLTLAD